MAKKELTDRVVEAYAGGEVYESGKQKGEVKPYPVLWDTIEPGFGVRYSTAAETRTYIYQRRVKGTKTERCITIGRHGEQFIDKKGEVFSLDVKRARARATAYRLMMTEELTDPVAERQRKEAEKRRREQEERSRATPRFYASTHARAALLHVSMRCFARRRAAAAMCVRDAASRCLRAASTAAPA